MRGPGLRRCRLRGFGCQELLQNPHEVLDRVEKSGPSSPAISDLGMTTLRKLAQALEVDPAELVG
jgi:hypothetical protein